MFHRSKYWYQSKSRLEITFLMDLNIFEIDSNIFEKDSNIFEIDSNIFEVPVITF